MEVFLYLLDMYIDFQFILSSCGCIGNKCMVGVGWEWGCRCHAGPQALSPSFRRQEKTNEKRVAY